MTYFQNEIARLHAEIQRVWSPQSAAPLLLLFEGPLGVGKTTFTQELVAHWGGSKNEVQSPTFLKVIEHQLPSFGKLVHVDTYRMDTAAELADVGFEFMTDAKVWIVEWPEIFIEFLARRPDLIATLGFRDVFCLKIKMDPIHGSGGRGEGEDNRASQTRRVEWTRKSIKEILSPFGV